MSISSPILVLSITSDGKKTSSHEFMYGQKTTQRVDNKLISK